MPNITTKRKTVNINVEVSYDPEQIQRTLDLEKLADVENTVGGVPWTYCPVESALLVLSVHQLLNVSQELEIKFEIQPEEGELMVAQNF